MPKITILGSCRYSPYKILATPIPTGLNYHNEEGYQLACRKFYPAIEESDEIWVYSPEGTIGEHTKRDLDYARKNNKKVFYIISEDGFKSKFGDRFRELVGNFSL